jgi:hypothetical protein
VRLNPKTGKLRVALLLARDVNKAGEPETRELEFAELERGLTEIASVNREFERFVGFQDVENEKA